MKKLTTLALAAVLLLAPLTSFAAVDRAVIDFYSAGPTPNTMNAYAHFLDGGTEVEYNTVVIPYSAVTSTQSWVDAVKTAVMNYASAQGYPLTNGIIWDGVSPLQAQAIATSTASTLIAQATSTLNLPQAMSFANPARTLNSAFQISSTRAAFVNYSVDIATSVSLIGGQVGTVYLEYANDSGFTSGVTEVGRFVNGQTGTLVVGLTLNQTNTAQLSGIVPAGKYVRLRTQNNTGTPTFTYRSSQEVLLGSN